MGLPGAGGQAGSDPAVWCAAGDGMVGGLWFLQRWLCGAGDGAFRVVCVGPVSLRAVGL